MKIKMKNRLINTKLNFQNTKNKFKLNKNNGS